MIQELPPAALLLLNEVAEAVSRATEDQLRKDLAAINALSHAKEGARE